MDGAAVDGAELSGMVVLPPAGVEVDAFGSAPVLVPDRLAEEPDTAEEDPPAVDVVAAAADDVARVAACELVLV